MPTWAPSWPWPEMTNGIRPARLRTHIRSSTARASATRRYIARRSSSVRPAAAPSGCACRPVTVIASRSEIDASSVDRERRLAHDLGERRGRVRRPADLPGRRLQLEGDRRLGDEVRGVRADEVDAQGDVGLLVRDHLREALVLAADERLGDGLERHLADLHGDAAVLALLLAEADAGDLGAAVGRAGLIHVVDRVDVLLAGDHVRGDDPLVRGGVSKLKPADDVADGV